MSSNKDKLRPPSFGTKPPTENKVVPRNPTFESVQEAANRLNSRGLNVTVRAVRKELGRGSNTTINKLLQQIKAQNGPQILDIYEQRLKDDLLITILHTRSETEFGPETLNSIFDDIDSIMIERHRRMNTPKNTKSA
jgi:hypothetical protein